MIENNNVNSSQVVSSLGWRFFERIFSQISSIVIQIVLARLLMPSDFGNLAVIMAIVSYLSVLVQCGLSTAIVQKKELDQKDVNTLFTISILVATVLYLLLFFLSPIISDYYETDLTGPIRVTSLVLFIYSFYSIVSGMLMRRMDFKSQFVANALAVPFSGGIGILLAYLGYGLWALIIYVLLNNLFSLLIMAFRSNISLSLHYSKERAFSLYSYIIKIMGAHMTSGLGDLVRTMSIGKKYSASDLAYYDRAYLYASMVLQIINNSIQSVMLPVFSKKQDDVSKIKEISRISTRMSVFFICPFLLGVAMIAKPLVILLLTEKWLPCVPYLVLFLIFRLSGCLISTDKQVYLALGKSGILFKFEVALLFVNLLVLVITIPIGVMPIAVGYLIVEYIFTIVIMCISSKVFSYTIKDRIKDICPPIIYTIIMLISMWFVTLFGIDGILLIVCQITIGIITYFLIAFIFKDRSLLLARNIIRDKYHQINM